MYENSIIHLSTITIFDNYLKSEEEFFRIKDNFVFVHNNFSYVVNFVISKNQPQNQNYFDTNITIDRKSTRLNSSH